MLTPPLAPFEAMQNEEKIAALMALQATPGWLIVTQVIQENLAWLREVLEEGIDPDDGKKLSAEEQDAVRYKIKLNKNLMNTPQGYIEALRRAEGGKPNFDPYYQSKSDMISGENKN